MRTSLDRQIAILTAKKNELPDRPEKLEDKKPAQKTTEEVKPPPLKDLSTVVKLSNPAMTPITSNPPANVTVSNNGNKK